MNKQNEYMKSDFEKFHDYNCLVPYRTIYFGSSTYEENGTESGIDFLSTATLIKNLLFLDKLSRDPIYLHWNSPGGEWAHGMAIYDVITGLGSPVVMIGYGYVSSMGTIVMQACDRRYLTPNSAFVIHDGEEGYVGIPKSFESWAKECKYAREKMYKIYLENIKKNHPKKYKLSDIEDWCSKDTIFRPEQTVALGLADKVLS